MGRGRHISFTLARGAPILFPVSMDKTGAVETASRMVPARPYGIHDLINLVGVIRAVLKAMHNIPLPNIIFGVRMVSASAG